MAMSSAVLIGWTTLGIASVMLAGMPRSDRRRWLPTAAVFGPLFLAIALEQRDLANESPDGVQIDFVPNGDVPLWEFDDVDRAAA